MFSSDIQGSAYRTDDALTVAAFSDATHAAICPVIAFVGSCVTFTDRLMQTAEAEFRGIDVVRVSELGQLSPLSEKQRALVQLVVVDEAVALSSSTACWAMINQTLPGAALGLAYQSLDNAKTILAGPLSQIVTLRYIPMHAPIDAWLAALRLLLLGQHFVPLELLPVSEESATDGPGPMSDNGTTKLAPQEKIQKQLRIETFDDPSVKLTGRELQVLDFIAKGERNKAIAKSLGLSEHTVKLHVHHIFGKISVHNRTSATRWYLSQKSLMDRT